MTFNVILTFYLCSLVVALRVSKQPVVKSEGKLVWPSELSGYFPVSPVSDVWSPSDPYDWFRGGESYPTFATTGNWTYFGSGVSQCKGVVRYGSNHLGIYSLPVTVQSGFMCDSAASFGSQLFQVEKTDPCMCRSSVSLMVKTEGKCLIAPPAASGWPGPGLSDSCDSAQPWTYHRASGQLRQNGLCLTAKPYRQFVETAWSVTLESCSNTVRADFRQSWDLPELPSDAKSFAENVKDLSAVGVFDTTNTYSEWGKVAPIRLRDSFDIGVRCLATAQPPVPIVSASPGIVVQARLCEDSQYVPQEVARWRVLVSVSSVQQYKDWRACGTSSSGSDSCMMTCGIDGELRSSQMTQSVSVPYSFLTSSSYSAGQCSASLIRSMVVQEPQVSVGAALIRAADSGCFCQQNKIMSDEFQAVMSVAAGRNASEQSVFFLKGMNFLGSPGYYGLPTANTTVPFDEEPNVSIQW